MRLKTHLIMTALFHMIISEECFAPAQQWGEPCLASNALKGSSGMFITYIFVVRSPVSIFCQAVGKDSYPQHSTCSWGWHYLGSVANQSLRLLWDSAEDYPAIRCYGFPEAGYFEWSYFALPGHLSCESSKMSESGDRLLISAHDRQALIL